MPWSGIELRSGGLMMLPPSYLQTAYFRATLLVELVAVHVILLRLWSLGFPTTFAYMSARAQQPDILKGENKTCPGQ